MALRVDKKTGLLVVPESSIESGCTTLLELDGWRSFKMEQNYSERKVKVVGEKGMPDRLYIRYKYTVPATNIKYQGWNREDAEIIWIEWKSAKGKASAEQRLWHEAERKRGALVLVAGVDLPASIEGFLEWYRKSGLMRRAI